MDFVESFEELKSELKEEWLDFYAENQDWIEKLGVYRDVQWGDKYRTHNHYFLLGVLSALEPKFCNLLKVFVKLNSNPETVAQVLDILNLNLKQELEKREAEKTQQAELIPLLQESFTQEDNCDPDVEYLDRIRQDMSQ